MTVVRRGCIAHHDVRNPTNETEPLAQRPGRDLDLDLDLDLDFDLDLDLDLDFDLDLDLDLDLALDPDSGRSTAEVRG